MNKKRCIKFRLKCEIFKNRNVNYLDFYKFEQTFLKVDQKLMKNEKFQTELTRAQLTTI